MSEIMMEDLNKTCETEALSADQSHKTEALPADKPCKAGVLPADKLYKAGALLADIRKSLQEAGIEEAASEAWLILEEVCGINRATYFAEPDKPIPCEMVERVEKLLEGRRKRIPLQYLLGTCEFMGYPFYVDERVLIPRQDTECLVDLALETLKDMGDSPAVLDLCSGSGCIGLSIKKIMPKTRVTLSDLSEDALAVARENAHRLSCQVELVQGDLFENLRGPFHMILSNPPYIPSEVIEGLMPEVKDYEPRLALDGEKDGLAFYRRIVSQAGEYLLPGGWLMLEIGMDQGEDLKNMLAAMNYKDIAIKKDLAGLDRIALARTAEP